ncbi:vWA domain-containing protein [Micromonospora sp. NBC_01796]|uniref:vWA domain-containing protein n=1 Tax=Micromonospora sp. NBC_01796 TaxID=2975987 RepID=UPI002DD962F8|nr:vWA domain-containing protein [Micromonospora sp. NBC_01796]WSA83775.1 VWA domain-containing protein [Micromonospora sp. NBC_01796]
MTHLDRAYRKLLPLFAATLAVAVNVLSVPAAPAVPARFAPAQAGLAEVLRDLRVDRLPADYVVLVDVSSSMQDGADLYRAAKDALRPLLAELDPVDRLHLFAFANRPDPKFSGAVGGVGAGALDRMPGTADGTATDIGAAIEAALDIVEEAGNTDPATVILLTDGRHDPPVNSRYAGNASPAFARLTERARRVEQRRNVRAYGVPLAGRTDVQLLDEVFENTILMDLPPDQVGSYLDRIRGRVAVQKAAAYVARDQLTATAALPPGGLTVGAEPVEIVARFRSSATRVPITVGDLRVEIDGVELRAVPERPEVLLTPAEPEQEVRIRVEPVTTTERRIGGERTRDGELRVTGTVDSPWRDVITRDLELAFTPAPASATAPARHTTTGFPIWLLVLVLVLLVIAVGLAFYLPARRWKAMGSGSLSISEPEQKGPYRQPLSGRTVRFPSPLVRRGGLSGSGTVRARRLRRETGSGRELVLYVDYRRDGKRHRVTCRPRQTESLRDGTTFTYQP